MTVAELIVKLIDMPMDAQVRHIWDGAARTTINHVYLANNGDVMTIDNVHVVYYNEDQPLGVPDTGSGIGATKWYSPGGNSDD